MILLRTDTIKRLAAKVLLENYNPKKIKQNNRYEEVNLIKEVGGIIMEKKILYPLKTQEKVGL